MKKNLSECVITKINLDGETILAKNRDRGYKAEVSIIHEIVDGVEVCYLHDKLSDWSEGLNEFGIGIISSSLQVFEDEKEGMKVDKNSYKKPKISKDGLKIRKALCKNNLRDAIKTAIYYYGEDKNKVGITGHTIIANPKNTYILELTADHFPILKKKLDKIITRSNHGIYHPTAGYISGINRLSSIYRLKITQENLKFARSQDDILDIMSRQHIRYKFLNPYRRKNKFKMFTTAQILYNLNNLDFILRCDLSRCKFIGYDNRLPEEYEPKIKVKVEFMK